MLLLNPGPVTLSERVRGALARADLCHREPEFTALQTAVRQGLLGVYELDPREYSVALLPGSGTAAVEAMLATLVPRDGRLLVLDNGVYGERMARIAAIHGIDHLRLEHPWDAALDVERLAAVLERSPVTHLAVVHHETTTGRLNDLAAVAAVCRARGVALLVDAVSSFGAEPIDFAGWGVAACAATANKCLHGVPGTAFVVARRQALAAAAAPPRTLYLDAVGWERAQREGGTPFTPAVHSLFALEEALRELAEEGGREARRRRYALLAGIVRAGLAAAGIEPLLPPDACSVVVAAYRLPHGVDYAALHDGLKRRGFVIYAGQGRLAADIVRVSTMGAITEADMHRFADAVAELASGG